MTELESRLPERGGIAAFALRHGRTVLLVALLLCVAGVVSAMSLASGIYPDVAFPRVVVVAERGQESVESMLIGVTRPIEEGVSVVPGLVRVRSKTIRGASELSLDFAPSADLKDALAQTRARVAALLPSLPPGVETSIEQQTPSVFPVLSFNVNLDPARAGGRVRDGADLLQWAALELKPRLSRLDDVFRVGLQGSASRALVVEVEPARLAGAHLSLLDVSKSIRESNLVSAVGLLPRDGRQFQLLAANDLPDLEAIGRLPIATPGGGAVRLGDIARIRAGAADRTKIVTGDGRDGVVVSIFMRYGGKVTALSDHVAETLRGVGLPPGVSFTTVYDQASLVRESIDAVRDAIGIGMLLAVLVLWLFLGSVRLSVLAGISIPISVLGTFAVLVALGESLNLMSLGGVAVAIGLIIDDAIVVVENIARRLGDSKDRRAGVVRATREVVGAVVGSSLTTVVVFIPLVLLEGVVGQFFRAMSVALSIGILASLVVSLTLTPLLAAGRLGPVSGQKLTRRAVEAIAAGYERVLRLVMRWPWISAAVLVALGAVGVFFAVHQKTGFLPAMDEGGFVIDYRLPVGSSLDETDRDCRAIERILARVPEIRAFSRRTGAELGFFATEQNTGDFLVGLKPRSARKRTFAEIIEDVRSHVALEVPQLDVSFVQVIQDTINDLAGNPSPLEVKVFGADYRATQRTATAIAGALEHVHGVVDIASGVSFGSPEMTYHLDPTAIARAGLSPSGVADQLRAALAGDEATQLRRGEQLVPVIVRYPDRVRRDPGWIPDLPVADAAGRTIPISALARVEEVTAVNELARENQQPMVAITAGIEGRDLGSVAADVRKLLAATPLPTGVRLELAGQVESQERAFRNLMLVLSLAIGFVFLLLVAQFRSYRLPFVVLLTLPFSQIGGLLALRWTGTELNISAFMGLVMLVGLVVKNGIILIEYAAQLRAEGVTPLAEALVRASRVRLRPILMTSLTAVTALLPLALGIGAGAELQRPLAIAIIGGLSLSTVFTLLVIPVAHRLVGEPAHARPLVTEGVTP